MSRDILPIVTPANPRAVIVLERLGAAIRAEDTAHQQVEAARRDLHTIQSACHHEWDSKYTPDYQPGYTAPGDTPGTMGIDFRGPIDVPSKTTPKWTRYCKVCGKSEITTCTKSVATQEPVW